MQSSSKVARKTRRRAYGWFAGGVAAAAVCLGGTALLSQRWLESESGLVAAVKNDEGQRATLAEPDETPAPPPVPADAGAPELDAGPSDVLVPWAWLDAPARPDADALRDYPERVYVARSEVEPVAGRDGADAGVPAGSDDGDAGAPEELEPPEEEEPEEPPDFIRERDAGGPLPPPLGEPCGLVVCEIGFGCCNPSCGVCVAPGQNCDPTPCESRIQYPVSELCGRSTCSVGEVCCNPSCGTCVEPGESCDPTPCDNPIVYPFSPSCGRVTCAVGQECCNPSCGICVAPGETCSQQLCD